MKIKSLQGVSMLDVYKAMERLAAKKPVSDRQIHLVRCWTGVENPSREDAQKWLNRVLIRRFPRPRRFPRLAQNLHLFQKTKGE